MLSKADLGAILSVTGSQATAHLPHHAEEEGEHARVTIGRLVAIHSDGSRVIGVVSRLTLQPSGPDIVADIDFMGEIKEDGPQGPYFQRGVTNYPTIGDRIALLQREELSLIHKIDEGETIKVGQLQMDAEVPAYVNFDELLHKHFAVLGTTGVGKSTSVALILQEILKKKANLRIFLIDPHNEYGHCFGEQTQIMNPKNLRLPFWLFNFEEIVDVFFRGRPGVEEETEILSELIPIAKAQYSSAHARAERILVRKVQPGGFTADTPVPYRISDLISLINDRMGKLENRSSWTKYHRLIMRIETLQHDSRYTFMFNNLFIEDLMVKVLGELFRMPTQGRPITVMQLAGFPAEVVDSVVSVLCRMAFDFGVWSDASVPILVCCEEAHRYAPADRKLGFGPTRKALSRIAKEGRKYGVFLGVITQRPAELDPTSCRSARPSSPCAWPTTATRRSCARPCRMPVRARSISSPRSARARRSPSAKAWRCPCASASATCRRNSSRAARPAGTCVSKWARNSTAASWRAWSSAGARRPPPAPVRAAASPGWKTRWIWKRASARRSFPAARDWITAPPRAVRGGGSSPFPAPRIPWRRGRAMNRTRGRRRDAASTRPASPPPRSTARIRR